MILLLDTSTPTCKMTLVDDQNKYDFEWLSERNLAKGLLKFIHDNLLSIQKDWHEISAIGVYEGPGSFTGLRIGITVVNTIADAQNIPIVGASGDNWQNDAVAKINAGENAKIVLPMYGSEANITVSRK